MGDFSLVRTLGERARSVAGAMLLTSGLLSLSIGQLSGALVGVGGLVMIVLDLREARKGRRNLKA